MKRAPLAVAAVLVAGLVGGITPGHADTIQANCKLDGVKAAGAFCYSEFDLTVDNGARFVSVLYTHADYHAVTLDAAGNPASGGSGTNGVVNLKWYDGANGGGWDAEAGAPRGDLIVQYDCQTVAYQSDYQVTEALRDPLCSQVGTAKTQFTVGTQVVLVTAKTLNNGPANGIRLNGRLALKKACPDGNPSPGEDCDRI